MKPTELQQDKFKKLSALSFFRSLFIVTNCLKDMTGSDWTWRHLARFWGFQEKCLIFTNIYLPIIYRAFNIYQLMFVLRFTGLMQPTC